MSKLENHSHLYHRSLLDIYEVKAFMKNDSEGFDIGVLLLFDNGCLYIWDNDLEDTVEYAVFDAKDVSNIPIIFDEKSYEKYTIQNVSGDEFWRVYINSELAFTWNLVNAEGFHDGFQIYFEIRDRESVILQVLKYSDLKYYQIHTIEDEVVISRFT